MYLEHFGLREYPFSITPDTSFFFKSSGAQKALNTLLMALHMGEGFIKITGEVGTGKTLLCRKLINSLGKDYKVAYIFNPYREPLSLCLEVCKELGVRIPESQMENQYQVLQALAVRMLELNRAGKRVVICLDEAQAMPVATLETLRLLTNLESQKQRLAQIVIFGQPELDEKLNHPSIRQLKQRITYSYQLPALANSQFDAYIRHRLLSAGHVDGQLFTPGALRALRKHSRRVPRRINILAHKSLLCAYGDSCARVESRHVSAAVNDTEGSPRAASNQRWKALALGLTLSLLMVLVVGGIAIYKGLLAP